MIKSHFFVAVFALLLPLLSYANPNNDSPATLKSAHSQEAEILASTFHIPALAGLMYWFVNESTRPASAAAAQSLLDSAQTIENIGIASALLHLAGGGINLFSPGSPDDTSSSWRSISNKGFVTEAIGLGAALLADIPQLSPRARTAIGYTGVIALFTGMATTLTSSIGTLIAAY